MAARGGSPLYYLSPLRAHSGLQSASYSSINMQYLFFLFSCFLSILFLHKYAIFIFSFLLFSLNLIPPQICNLCFFFPCLDFSSLNLVPFGICGCNICYQSSFLFFVVFFCILCILLLLIIAAPKSTKGAPFVLFLFTSYLFMNVLFSLYFVNFCLFCMLNLCRKTISALFSFCTFLYSLHPTPP